MFAYICICIWGVFFSSKNWYHQAENSPLVFSQFFSQFLHLINSLSVDTCWLLWVSHHTCVGCFFQQMNLKHLQMRHSKLSSTLFHTFFFLFFIGFSKTNYFLQSWIHVVTKHWCEMNNLHCSKVRNTHWQIVSVNKDVISCDIHSVPGQSQTELVCCWCVRSWCKKKDGDVTRAGMCGTS